MLNNSTLKTRDLSTYEYFLTLQKEYIVADLRVKIYPKLKDKDYWTRTREGKKQRIEDIAERNHIPSIFDDEQAKRETEAQIYMPIGIPRFIYKSEENRNKQELYDYIYYFAVGSDVRFEYLSETKIGQITEYNHYTRKVTIKFTWGFVHEEMTESFPIDRVTRIL